VGGNAVGRALYIAATINAPQKTMRITTAENRKNGLSVGLISVTTTNPTMSSTRAAMPKGDTAALAMVLLRGAGRCRPQPDYAANTQQGHRGSYWNTQFLYDILNPVQELSGASVVADLLTGLAIDEYFTRTDAAGASHFLTDALGATVALTDASGSPTTTYTYEPFGATAVIGPDANPFQYTGRENDGTGLYYYRARYFHPGLQRFISEDPIEFNLLVSAVVIGANLLTDIAYCLIDPRISYR